MSKDFDLDDSALEAMFAELDEQNKKIMESREKEAEPKVEVKPETDAIDEAVLAELEAETQTVTVAIAELPDATLEPTSVDVLNAEQTLDLEEAFAQEQAEVPDQQIADEVAEMVESLEVEPDEAVAVEANELPPVEAEQLPAVEPAIEINTESTSIPGFVPKPAERAERSEKALMELAKLKYQPDVEAFNRDIAFTDATLSEAMVEQSSLVAFQNERAARAAAQAAKLKLKFDSIEATLYEAYRKKFIEDGEKVTEKAIENAVRKDSRWRAAKEKVIEAEMYADIHKGFVFALKDRCDMLIQRGAYFRQERQGQMRMSAPDGQYSQSNSMSNSELHQRAMNAMKNSNIS